MEDMLALAGLTKGMRVLELGSGNGELSIRAAEHGAIAIGFDVNRLLVWYAQWRARRRHVSITAKFICADFLATKLPRETSVVFVYLLPGLMERTWPKLVKDLAPGTVVISHAFEFKGQTLEARRGKAIRYRIP